LGLLLVATLLAVRARCAAPGLTALLRVAALLRVCTLLRVRTLLRIARLAVSTLLLIATRLGLARLAVAPLRVVAVSSLLWVGTSWLERAWHGKVRQCEGGAKAVRRRAAAGRGGTPHLRPR
jgi:hypothetical protein